MSRLDARNIIHLVPMFRYAILLIIGIALGDLFAEVVSSMVWLVVLFVFILLAYLLDKRSDIASSIMIFCGVAAVGGFRMSYSKVGEYVVKDVNKTMECKICAITEPIERGKVSHFDGIICHAPEGPGLEGTKVRVSMLRDTITGKFRSVHIGDGIEGTVDVSPLKEWYRQNSHFDYIKWLHARGFYSRAFVPIGKWELVENKTTDIGIVEGVKLKALQLRQMILERMKGIGMEEKSFAVATAMVLGNKTALSPEIRDEYSNSGVSHILALSGVHLSIIYIIMLRVFGRKRYGRIITGLMIWGYVVFTGMPVSILRAACMLTLIEVLDMFGVSQKNLNILGMTAFIMLMFNPQCLWDIGFQMSFMSMLAIISLMEPIREIMPNELKPKNKKEKKMLTRKQRHVYSVLRTIWFAIAISLSAQLGAMPLTAYYFGKVPLCFLLTNLIAIVFVPIIIYMTMAMALVIVFDLIVGIGSGLATYGIGWLLSWVVYIMNGLFRVISGIPGASIGNVYVNEVQLVAMYVVVGVVLVWVNRSRLKGLL